MEIRFIDFLVVFAFIYTSYNHVLKISRQLYWEKNIPIPKLDSFHCFLAS